MLTQLRWTSASVALGVLLCATVPVVAADFPAPALAADEPAMDPQPVWLQVSLNGQVLGTELLMLQRSQVWVDPALLTAWRLAIPATAASRTLSEGRFVSLDSLPGLTYAVDAVAQQLQITAAAGALQHNRIEARRNAAPTPQLAATGSFLNYDVSAGVAGDNRSLGGLFEMGVFGRMGYATNTFLAGDSAFGDARVVRLETAWVRDDPQRLRTLRIGDAISATGSYGRARRFAGLQWGSNFDLQPDLVTFPLPSASGSSSVPATVDVYVDQVLRLRQEVPAGPFELSGLPVTSGAGQTELVITDALGRQQRLPYNFYTSTQLLRRGLREWQYSAGVQRERFGQASFDYGETLLSGVERYGFSDRLTGEWNGEWTAEQVRSGVGVTWLQQGLGILQADVAASHADAGSGYLGALALQRQARRLSIGGSVAWSSRDFDAAALPGERTPRIRQQGSVSWSLGSQGSLALGWLKQRRHDGTAVELANLGYSRNVGRFGFFNASVQRLFEPEDDWSLALSLIMPLDGGQIVSASYGRDGDDGYFRLDLQRSPPAGEGWGYRVLVEPGDRRRLDAGVVYQGSHAVLRAELSQLMRQTQGRIQANGGLLLLGGQLHASRPLTSSFAVVEVADYPGVRVYADNQWVATTGTDGRALIPRLRPWQANALRVEQADLPMDARIDALELEAVPPARSGLQLAFAVQAQRSLTLLAVLDDGQPVAAGTRVLLLPSGRELPLGLEGRIYVDDLAPTDNRLQLHWREQSCELPLDAATDDVQPDLGVLICTGVQR